LLSQFKEPQDVGDLNGFAETDAGFLAIEILHLYQIVNDRKAGVNLGLLHADFPVLIVATPYRRF
jgi:hypothetical protein